MINIRSFFIFILGKLWWYFRILNIKYFLKEWYDLRIYLYVIKICDGCILFVFWYRYSDYYFDLCDYFRYVIIILFVINSVYYLL